MMKKYIPIILIILVMIPRPSQAQTIDTLIDVGGYYLNFHIIKGKGTPILFENGSGADVSNWDTLLKPLSSLTGATLIAYDRAGFGKSGLDHSNQDLDKHGILQGIQGLEKGLQKLGYDHEMILVASSFGGFCATLYAARHPEKVKAAVFIDANHVCWFTDNWVQNEMLERRRDAEKTKAQNLAYYYQSLNLQTTVELMKKNPFPSTIPIIDLVSEKNFPDSVLSARWRECHREFAAAQPNRKGITAYGCGHIIFNDNLPLVVNAIALQYAVVAGKKQAADIRERALINSLEQLNRKSSH